MCNCNGTSGALAFPNFVANACCNPCCDKAVVAQRVDSVQTENQCGCCNCCCGCCCNCGCGKCCGGSVAGTSCGGTVGGTNTGGVVCPPKPPCRGYVDPIWGCIEPMRPGPFCPCSRPYPVPIEEAPV